VVEFYGFTSNTPAPSSRSNEECHAARRRRNIPSKKQHESPIRENSDPCAMTSHTVISSLEVAVGIFAALTADDPALMVYQ
jgi:hypothetical protein